MYMYIRFFVAVVHACIPDNINIRYCLGKYKFLAIPLTVQYLYQISLSLSPDL